MARQTGETTRQMEAAPQRAVFIWCNNALSYPRDLARKLGRTDLMIVGPEWLTSDRWRGLELTAIVRDHALSLKGREFQAWDEVQTRIRPHARFPKESVRTESAPCSHTPKSHALSHEKSRPEGG